jgi:hypothetical protein
LVATCGLLVPAAAWAEPPANDNFENRQVLGPGFPGGLPIEVEASNVEATKESGESIPGLSPAGHSVWYEWEAESTGWTTIGACEADFASLVGVFTGSKVDELTPVSGNASEGPSCSFGQREYTFKAKAGTKYEIAVDGNGFFVEPPPPVTQGEFTLRIEATPPPPNDDFEEATVLEAPIGEEPGGNRFYLVDAHGYNWGATTQAGEPAYPGGPPPRGGAPAHDPESGATVWYSWTAPESGEYHFAPPCCASGLRRAIYSGDAVGALTPVLAGTESGTLSVAAGTTLRIVVYGLHDPETEEPKMARFNFLISANLPPLPKPPPAVASPPPPPDTTPPQTRIVRTKLLSATGTVKFWLSSSEPGGGFLCRLGKAPYKACASPKGYRHLKPGSHTFRVKAVDAAGNVDPSPAIARIKFPRGQRHHRR